MRLDLNRREFLKITAGAGAALAMPTPGNTAVSSSKMIGIQVGAISFADEGTEKVLGTTSLLLRKVSVNGNFALASGTTCGDGTALAPNAQCVLNVTFTPSGTGKRTGCVTIHDNTLLRLHKVDLSGVGD